MPSLPVIEEPPTRAERVSSAMHRAGAAIGADNRVTVRALVFFVLIVVGLSFAPAPWAQVGLVGTMLLAFDWIRARRA